VVSAYQTDGLRMGIDLEWIEHRGEEFVSDYFTPGERYHILQSPLADRPLLATLYWSAKEAVLKALSTGLRKDTRSIEIDCGPSERKPEGWQPLGIKLNFTGQNSLRLWWRREENYVISICLPVETEELPVRIVL